MNKFKIGDKVRVREDLETGCQYGGLILLSGLMTESKGKEDTIEDILENKYYQLSNLDFWWGEDMLELVEDDKKIKRFESFNKVFDSNETAQEQALKMMLLEISEDFGIEEENQTMFVEVYTDVFNSMYEWMNEEIDKDHQAFYADRELLSQLLETLELLAQ